MTKLIFDSESFDAYPGFDEPKTTRRVSPVHLNRGEKFEFALENELNRSSPDYIRWVQNSLNKIMGLRLAVDGILGPQTRSAIRSFQQKNGLTVDGIVGTNTEARLMALSGVQSWGATPVSASVVPRSLPSPCFSQSHFPCPQTIVIDHFAGRLI